MRFCLMFLSNDKKPVKKNCLLKPSTVFSLNLMESLKLALLLLAKQKENVKINELPSSVTLFIFAHIKCAI